MYTALGVFTGTFRSSNTGKTSATFYAYGGNPPPKKINYGDADNCANTYSLVGSVNGSTIVSAVDANSEWNKTGFITFSVPPGNTIQIVSNGMSAYGCSAGSFQVYRYQ
ncbi:prepilin, shufflon protein A [Salmonella enterica subsp. enterica serovar Winslow]